MKLAVSEKIFPSSPEQDVIQCEIDRRKNREERNDEFYGSAVKVCDSIGVADQSAGRYGGKRVNKRIEQIHSVKKQQNQAKCGKKKIDQIKHLCGVGHFGCEFIQNRPGGLCFCNFLPADSQSRQNGNNKYQNPHSS